MNQANRDKKKPATLKILIAAFLIIITAIVIASILIKTAPRPGRKPPREEAALVEAIPLKTGTGEVIIEATGTVEAARKIELRTQVSGEIVEINPAFRPGGRLEAGEEILQIDPRDYRLEVEDRKADLVEAEQEYQIELGRQDIARHEWSLLSDRGDASQLDRSLALRRPQLEQAKAAVAAARARLDQAELNLERCSVTAPFNAVILSKDVDLGTQVTSSTVLGNIAGTDEFWLKLLVPVGDLGWFTAGGPEEGAPVKLYPSGSKDIKPVGYGRVIEKQADLDDKGRLAQVVVSIPRPLENPDRPLLLGMYLRAAIEGISVPRVFSIPPRALRGEGSVWLIDTNQRLKIQNVETVWIGPDRILIQNGLTEGDLLIVSDLGAPVEGMLLSQINEGTNDEGRGEGISNGQ